MILIMSLYHAIFFNSLKLINYNGEGPANEAKKKTRIGSVNGLRDQTIGSVNRIWGCIQCSVPKFKQVNLK